jgi:hypothetical protein
MYGGLIATLPHGLKPFVWAVFGTAEAVPFPEDSKSKYLRCSLGVRGSTWLGLQWSYRNRRMWLLRSESGEAKFSCCSRDAASIDVRLGHASVGARWDR